MATCRAPSLTDKEQADLLAKATEHFAELALDVLQSLAKRRFHIKDGDWKKIPSYRLPDALRSLDEKAEDDACDK